MLPHPPPTHADTSDSFPNMYCTNISMCVACLMCLTGRKAALCHPTPQPLILQRATGRVSRHWLHLLHLGCLAFFSSPKWSCEFHVAGRVTDWEMGASKWEIRRSATSKLHNGLSNRHWTLSGSCHLQFGERVPR